MADARALLRSQRETRRIDHPHASYGKSGRLLCTACNTTIKSEQFWPNHLRNPEHVARVQKLQSASTVQANKKRKVDDDDDTSDVEEGRKRIRATDAVVDESSTISSVTVEQLNGQQRRANTNATDQAEDKVAPISVKAAPVEEEDADWLELQRAIDSANVPSSKPSLTASATISAPAMSAEEIAAQAREEQSVQRGRRDEEIAGEKEDAARALQDEFQEMEELEDRVRKLREKREALRAGRQEDMSGPGKAAANSTTTAIGEDARGDNVDGRASVADAIETNYDGEVEENAEKNDDVDDDDDDDDDEDFDSWTFGVR